MGPVEKIAREIRYASGLARVFWRIREIKSDSDVLICDDFEAAADRFADHTALVFEGASYTYRQLDALANRFAAWGLAHGVKRGDAVALMLPNRAEYVPAWAGLAKIGAAAALINNNLTGAALAHCVSISGARHVVTDMDTLPAFDTIRAGLARPVTVWVIDAHGDLGAENRQPLDLKQPPLAPERPPRSLRAGIKAADTALYIYTSGTTGMPKAAKARM